VGKMFQTSVCNASRRCLYKNDFSLAYFLCAKQF
jgi:hypothetical protein